MKCKTVMFSLALVATGTAKAQDIYKPYRFCVASSSGRKEIYYSDVFKLTSDEALRNGWRQHLLLYHSDADPGSMDCTQAAETKSSALAARTSAVTYLRRGDADLRAVDTEWTPGH